MHARLPRDAKRIAVFRALHLGDILCAVPALRALRTAYPDSDITLIGLPSMAELAARFPRYISSFVSFPGVPGLPEQAFDPQAFTDFVLRENEACYDVAIQMHGKGSVTNPVVCMLGATRCAGYYEEGEFCPDNNTFMPYPENIPEVRRHLRLMEFLGIPSCGEALEFPLHEQDWKQLDLLAEKHGVDMRNYACIHPGARDVRRWWEPAKFACVADQLVERGTSVVFTGTEGERDTVERVRQKMRHQSTSLVGETDLGVLAALVGRARLLVSNDTGVSHIAAAMGTPSVVIFLASDPLRWAPLDGDRHQVVLPEHSTDVDGVMHRVEKALGQSAAAL